MNFLSIFLQNQGLLLSLFWLVVVVAGIWWFNSRKKDIPADEGVAVLDRVTTAVPEWKVHPEYSNKISEAKKYPSPNKGRSFLAPYPLQEFDPTNLDHLEAINLLRLVVPRQHPTIRFHYDPAQHLSAVTYVESRLIDYWINLNLCNKGPQ